VLPLDDWRSRTQRYFNPQDINQHLYAWTPQSIGNLFQLAGYKSIAIKIITKAWSVKIFFLYKFPLLSDLSQYFLSVLKKRRQLLVTGYK